MVGKSTKFDQQNIDRIVGDVVGFMESTPATRSAGTRSVAEIRPLAVTIPAASAETRSGEESNEDTEEELFYLVNFENDQGYSIIAADHRIRDEIALFVGNGNLDETEVENPGLAIMLSRLDDYAARSIAEYEAWCDSVETNMLARIAEDYAELADEIAAYLDSLEQGESGTRIDPLPEYENEYEVIDTEYVYGPWTAIEQIEPMIPVEWGQKGVFNDRAAEEEGEDVASGCVAITLIQLMAYWEYPTVFHGVTMNWDTAIQYTGSQGNRDGAYKTWQGPMSSAPDSIKNAVADYIWYIGEDVDMNWGVDGSGTQNSKAINFLQDLGYSAPSRQNYSFTPVLNSLNNERPVYTKGNTDQDFFGLFASGVGHTWLIDGYLNQQQTVTVTYTWHPILNIPTPITRTRVLPEAFTTTETYNYSREFFHNNFGWQGKDNGYYVPGIFDTSGEGNGSELPSDTRSTAGNYQYNLRVWTNIYH
jgi:hypothetical protein